jgi:adenylate cyclase
VPYLIEQSDGPAPVLHELRLGCNRIGRELSNDIVFVHSSLSRNHAEIELTQETVYIRDLGSLNHTYVNESQINQCPLQDGDLIRFGGVVCKFVTALRSDPQRLPNTAELVPTAEDLPGSKKFSVLTQLPPDHTSTTLAELITQNSPDQKHSVINLRQQESHARTVDKLKILLEVSKQLSAPQALDQLLDNILNLLFEIMHVDRGGILLFDVQTHQLEQRAVKFRNGIPETKNFYSATIAESVYQQGEAILAADAANDSRFNDSRSILQQSIHASMCVPLKPKNEVVGVLYVDNLSLTYAYNLEDLEFLSGLANQAAIALDNAQLYQQIQTETVLRTRLEQFFPKSVWKKIEEEGGLGIIETDVTVLFADISRFTQLSSQMEPRQIIEMLNEYFTVLVEEIIFKYEGTLANYMGDGLLAVWGAPYAHSEDADRAVQAAIAMQKAVCAINQRWAQQRNLQIQIHIGLNSGTVAAGNIGSERLIQFGTIGDTVNVGSRICDTAKADEIFLSQSTVSRLKNRQLPLHKTEPVQVKGKTEPLQLYRLDWTATSSADDLNAQ